MWGKEGEKEGETQSAAASSSHTKERACQRQVTTAAIAISPHHPQGPLSKAHLLDAAHVEVLEEAAVRHARRRDGVVVVVGARRGGGQQRGHRAEHAVAFFLRWVVVLFEVRGTAQDAGGSFSRSAARQCVCLQACAEGPWKREQSPQHHTHRSAAAQQRAAHGAPQRRRRATHTPRVARGPPRLLPARLARISRAPGQELAALAIDGLLLLLLWTGEERESEKVSEMCVRPEKIAVSRSLAPHDVSLPRCVPASVSPAAGREQRRRSSAAEGAPGLCACEERVAKEGRQWSASCVVQQLLCACPCWSTTALLLLLCAQSARCHVHHTLTDRPGPQGSGPERDARALGERGLHRVLVLL